MVINWGKCSSKAWSLSPRLVNGAVICWYISHNNLFLIWIILSDAGVRVVGCGVRGLAKVRLTVFPSTRSSSWLYPASISPIMIELLPLNLFEVWRGRFRLFNQNQASRQQGLVGKYGNVNSYAEKGIKYPPSPVSSNRFLRSFRELTFSIFPNSWYKAWGFTSLSMRVM